MPDRFIRLNLGPLSAPPERAPLFEQLLADARHEKIPDWRQAAFSLLVPGAALPALAPARLAAHGVRAEGYALLASPVHYVAELSTVRLPVEGLLRFTPAEAQQLAADFGAIWADAPVRLIATGATLCCVFEASLEVRTLDPQRALGQHVDRFLPTGKDAARLRALASEIEMWLFDHALNRERTTRGAPVVNGLWLWGGGHSPILLPDADGGSHGEDVLFEAFAVAQPFEAQVLVTGAEPGSEAWRALDLNWLAPVADALRRGKLSGLMVSAGDSLWRVRSGRRLRFWRRPQPWWQSLDHAAHD